MPDGEVAERDLEVVVPRNLQEFEDQLCIIATVARKGAECHCEHEAEHLAVAEEAEAALASVKGRVASGGRRMVEDDRDDDAS